MGVWNFVRFMFGLQNKDCFLDVAIGVIEQFNTFSGKDNFCPSTTAYSALAPL